MLRQFHLEHTALFGVIGIINSCFISPNDDSLNISEVKEIIFDESHIEYGENQSYSSLDVGTKLVATNSGKFKMESSVTNYGIYFEITEKLQFNGNAVSAKIVMNQEEKK